MHWNHFYKKSKLFTYKYVKLTHAPHSGGNVISISVFEKADLYNVNNKDSICISTYSYISGLCIESYNKINSEVQSISFSLQNNQVKKRWKTFGQGCECVISKPPADAIMEKNLYLSLSGTAYIHTYIHTSSL